MFLTSAELYLRACYESEYVCVSIDGITWKES